MKTLVLATLLLLSSCGEPIRQNGALYECYGAFDKDEIKSQHVDYELELGNVVWAVILSETVIVPIWLVGWNIYCPVKVHAVNKPVQNP
jgi:hypothetical protein